jgi:3-methyl-2-oxobutanoate hydroxymethyltransferase
MESALNKAQAIKARKVNQGGKPIGCLTAYDYPTGRLLDEAGTDLILVGDSLGMVVLGFPDTTHVTLEHMLHHTAAVCRGVTNALVVGDLPIHSYDDPRMALEHAHELRKAGADAVKLEGGTKQYDKVQAIVGSGIPVLGHLGMLPQRIKKEGGYKKKGKTPQQAEDLKSGALALQEAGVFAIVLESIVPEVAQEITNLLDIPTIGIGCGNHTCDGEIAVISDVVGSFPWFVPPFAKMRAQMATQTIEAVKGYIKDVQNQKR